MMGPLSWSWRFAGPGITAKLCLVTLYKNGVRCKTAMPIRAAAVLVRRPQIFSSLDLFLGYPNDGIAILRWEQNQIFLINEAYSWIREAIQRFWLEKNCNTVSIFYASVGLLESLSLPHEWSRPKSVLHTLNIWGTSFFLSRWYYSLKYFCKIEKMAGLQILPPSSMYQWTLLAATDSNPLLYVKKGVIYLLQLCSE